MLLGAKRTEINNSDRETERADTDDIPDDVFVASISSENQKARREDKTRDVNAFFFPPAPAQDEKLKRQCKNCR